MTSELILYDAHTSPYTAKIRLALREKGIPFQVYVPPPPYASSNAASSSTTTITKPSSSISSNPRREVPALLDGPLKIWDSTIILDYIEDKWPTPVPLRASSPAGRAKARMIEELCDTHYEAINWGLGEVFWYKRAEGELASKLKAAAEAQTKEVHSWLTEQLDEAGGVYFGGEEFGMADVAVVPFVCRSGHWGLGPSSGSLLGEWWERVMQRPAVRQTMGEFEAVNPGYKAAAEGFLATGKKREYRDHRLEWMIKSGGIGVVVEGVEKGNVRFSWPYGVE